MSADHWTTVESIFHDALALPDAERHQFIRERAGNDEAMGREVMSLLEAHAATTVSRGSEDRTDWIGKRAGAYRITREIGRGGMGAIFLAIRDDDTFRKEVAVKVIKRGMDSDAIVRRFRNERQILADLDHPNIARLLDGGTTDEGLPFFVMEYIDGEPLDDYCRRVSIEQRLSLFARVCETVAYAHARGVIHRDLKPSNILITKTGEPKLLDFGIAKVLDTDSIDVSGTVTAAGHHVLTPAYASPEQIRGDQVTPASDVYSLGVILYELLTGSRPVLSDPQRPSTFASQRRLRGDVDNIVMMALDASPARRYADASGLARDIDAHLAGEPVRARRQTAFARARRLARKHATALVIVLAVAIATAVYLSREKPIPSAPVIRPADISMSRLTSFGDVSAAAISGDGKTLVYTRGTAAGETLWVRDLVADKDAKVVEQKRNYHQLLATRNGARVFFTFVAADGHDSLAVKSLRDAEPERVIATDTASAFALSPDEERLVFRRLQADQRIVMFTVEASGANKRVVWKSNPGETIGPVAWSADGREIIFSLDDTSRRRSTVWAIDPRSGAKRVALQSPAERVISIAALRDGSGAILITELQAALPKIWFASWGDAPAVRIAGDFSAYRFATVTDDSKSFVMRRVSSPSNIYELDLQHPDRMTPLTTGDNYFARSGLGYLPDGSILFNSISEGTPAILVLQRGAARPRALPIGIPARMPQINAATKRIAFLSSQTGVEEVWTCNFDGSDARQITKHGTVAQFDVLPDGQSIVYGTRAERGIFIAPVDGGPRRKVADLLIIQPTLVNQPGGWLAAAPNGESVLCDIMVTEGEKVTRRRGVVSLHDGSVRFYASKGGVTRQWLPDSSGFAAVVDSHNVWVQKLDGSPPYPITQIKSGELHFFAFAPDGKSLLLSWGETSRDVVMFKNFR